MAFRCCIPKHGTILYRYGGDLLHALSVSLWQQQWQPSSEHHSDNEKRKQVCTQLNTKFHIQAKRILDEDCSSPLHKLITDAVETCGGSTRLQKLLNRLGVCASIETHSRYVQYRVEKINKEGPMSGFPADSFMIVSADNLDYVHKYARSFSGKQNTSWHGTTIQIVQPKPRALTDSPLSRDPLAQSITHSDNPSEPELSMGKRAYTARSPHKTAILSSPCPKKAGRRRTGLENKQDRYTLTTRAQCIATP